MGETTMQRTQVSQWGLVASQVVWCPVTKYSGRRKKSKTAHARKRTSYEQHYLVCERGCSYDSVKQELWKIGDAPAFCENSLVSVKTRFFDEVLLRISLGIGEPRSISAV